MCLASVFGNFPSWKVIAGYRDIYYAKKIFQKIGCVEVRIVLEK